MLPGFRSLIPAAACAGLLAAGPFAAAQQPAPPPSASPTVAPKPASPPPTPTPAPTVAPTPLPSPSPSPTPPAATGNEQQALVDSLNPGELQEAVNLLRANYVRPGDVDDRTVARATLGGLLSRLDHGALLLPKSGDKGPSSPTSEPLPDAFVAEAVDEHTGYVRLGALTRDHLNDLDKTLRDFADKKLPALVLDLRATGGSSDYELAADVIRRFVAKGKPLFTLRKPSNNQERLFTSNGDPAFGGSVLIAVDADTAGAAETIAAVIRNYNRSLVVGATTAGQAVEYADLRLSGGTLLRIAVSQVVLPANLSIFPQGVKPDLAVKLARAEKIAVFLASQGKSIAPFVFEAERAHFNEAALVSGVNPEYDLARDRQAAQRRGEPPPKPPLRDFVLQRAFDMATAIQSMEAVRPLEAR